MSNQIQNPNIKWLKQIMIFAIVIMFFMSALPVFAQSKFIPQCALDNPTGNPADEKECRSVSVFVILLINVASYLFTIVGALALLFFIYGGFTLILSRGATEQVKKGKDIMVAAVIGLVIVFGAYMLVRFLGTAVGLKGDYKLTPSTNPTPTNNVGSCSDVDGVCKSACADNESVWTPPYECPPKLCCVPD